MFTRLFSPNKRRFADLSEQEILALAITSEEDDQRIYENFANHLRADFPQSAKIFDDMAAEENEHRRWLIDMHKQKFGEQIPLIRREHVAGFYARKPLWLMKQKSLDEMRRQAADMEAQAARYYAQAAKQVKDASIRKLLGDLARAEAGHISAAINAEKTHLNDDIKQAEEAQAHRRFVLTYIQPGLAGLIDGSVSTLAPIFATAFATQDTWTTFLVGLAASVGAGISMGFTEVASDDGVISGRGSPIIRGFVTGIMTAIGGLGHALPYLIPHFWTATYVALGIVIVELFVITFIQHKYMQTPWLKAMLQIVLGGVLVLGAGMAIGGI